MNLAEVLARLALAGTDQNRKVYARHGVTPPAYGVSYAAQNALAKEIGTDHALALALWDTGNHDARVLATKIEDPALTTTEQLQRWIDQVDNYVLGDALAVLVVRTPHARTLGERWCASSQEWIASVGWTVLPQVSDLGEDECLQRLAEIEARLHASANRVRYAMNGALIMLALRSPRLEKAARASARRIGRVEVDHGFTGCKTPDALETIEKAVARREGGARGATTAPAGKRSAALRTAKGAGSRASAASKPAARSGGAKAKPSGKAKATSKTSSKAAGRTQAKPAAKPEATARAKASKASAKAKPKPGAKAKPAPKRKAKAAPAKRRAGRR